MLPRARFCSLPLAEERESEIYYFFRGPFVLNFRGWQNLPVVLIQQMLLLLFHTETDAHTHRAQTHTHTHTETGSALQKFTFTVSAFLFTCLSAALFHFALVSLFIIYAFRSLGFLFCLLPFLLLLFSTQTKRDGDARQTERERVGERERGRQQINNNSLRARAGASETTRIDNRRHKRVKKRQKSTTTATTPRKYLIKPKYLI